MTISDDVRAADSIAKIANEMAHYDWVMPPPIEIWAQRLQALADGRTACVRVMSEDEHRAEFLKHWNRRPGAPFAGDTNRIMAEAWWLACARANKSVKP
jgi:hypothetical protein